MWLITLTHLRIASIKVAVNTLLGILSRRLFVMVSDDQGNPRSEQESGRRLCIPSLDRRDGRLAVKRGIYFYCMEFRYVIAKVVRWFHPLRVEGMFPTRCCKRACADPKVSH